VTVVADTSPLCYLILIGEIDLLPKLFGAVSVPRMNGTA
jgi:predicted nucleic acid-binding protein